MLIFNFLVIFTVIKNTAGNTYKAKKKAKKTNSTKYTAVLEKVSCRDVHLGELIRVLH